MKRKTFYSIIVGVAFCALVLYVGAHALIAGIDHVEAKTREAAATYYDVMIPAINEGCVGRLYISMRDVARLNCVDGRVYGNLTNYVIRDTVKIYDVEVYNAKRKKEKVREYPTL